MFENIRSEGLRCACAPGMGATAEYCNIYDAFGVVCLTDDPQRARFYAVVVTKVTEHLPDDDMLVIEVDPDFLEPSMLNRRLTGGLEPSHEFDYKLRIPPEALAFFRWDSKEGDFMWVDLPPRSDW